MIGSIGRTQHHVCGVGGFVLTFLLLLATIQYDVVVSDSRVGSSSSSSINSHTLNSELHNLVLQTKQVLVQQRSKNRNVQQQQQYPSSGSNDEDMEEVDEDYNEDDDDDDDIETDETMVEDSFDDDDDDDTMDDQQQVQLEQIWSLTTTAKELTVQYQELLDLQLQQDKLIDQVNMIQMNHFIQIVHEFAEQYHEQYQQQQQKKKKQQGSSSDNSDDNDNEPVTIDRLKELLSPEIVLAQSEQSLYDYIRTIITTNQKEITELVSNHKIPMKQQHSTKLSRTTKSISGKNNDDDMNCLSPYDTAQTIHDGIHRYNIDQIGLFDICQDGATIVHEMTSPTYNGGASSPITTSTNSIDDTSSSSSSYTTGTTSSRIGNVWWNKYIPEDWEKWILPKGWEQWNDPTIPVLQFLYQWFRALGFSSGSKTSQLVSTNHHPYINAPPETILHPDTSPGSCWPMAGNKNGFVTIRLPYPIIITSNNSIAISLDHVSAFNVLDPTITMQSAPKQMKVYGFSSCSSSTTTSSCNQSGLGFDSTTKRLLVTNPEQQPYIVYNIHHVPGTISSVQTFPMMMTTTTTTTNHHQHTAPAATTGNDVVVIDEFALDEDDGTCSPTKPSCGGVETFQNNEVQTSSSISAIQIEILSNWGREDYTCIYRVRIHGEKA
jgi:Sad1 / UNC-like C-terminal